MNLLYVLFSTCHSIDLLDDYIDKDINILFSKNENFVLAHKKNLFDENSFVVTILNHEKDIGLNRVARLSKNGKKYSIKIGLDYMCVNNENLIRCDGSTDLFNIKEDGYGFVIQKKEKCLTFNESLEMSKCGLSNQYFIFKKLGLEEICKKKESDFIRSKKKKTKNKQKRNKISDKKNPVFNTEPNKETQKKRNKAIDNMLKKHIPDIENKPKVKKILARIYEAENGWSWPKLSLWYLAKFFCP